MDRIAKVGGFAGIIAFVLMVACSGDRPSSGSVVGRDSANVTIVENSTPAWNAGETWIVEPNPMLEIGLVDGPAEYRFVIAGSVVRLADGRIAVADIGAGVIRVYDEAGRHLASVSLRGQVPGELTHSSLYAMPGDSLLAFDIASGQLAIFDPTPNFVRSIPVPAPLGLITVHGVLSDGTALASSYGANGDRSRSLVRIRLDGSGADTVALLRGPADTLRTGPAPQPIIAAAADGYWFGSGESYEIGLYATDGRLVRVVRKLDSSGSRGVGTDSLETPPNPPSAAPQPTGVTLPDYDPLYSRALVDAEGNLWVWSLNAFDDRPPVWTVFDTQGRMLGEVRMPDGVAPTQIGSDFVLDTPYRDAFQAFHVRLYRLVKP